MPRFVRWSPPKQRPRGASRRRGPSTPRRLGALLLVPALALVTACTSYRLKAPSLLTAVSDIVADHRSEGPGGKQELVASLLGTLPMPDVGYLYYYADEANPMTSFGMTGGEKSYRLEGMIEGTATPSDLHQIRDRIQGLQEAAAMAISARIELAIHEDPLEDRAVRRLFTTSRTRTEATTGTPATTSTTRTIESQVEAPDWTRKLSSPAGLSTTDCAIEPGLRDRVECLEAVVRAESRYVSNLVRSDGVFVFRWDAEKSDNLVVEIPPFFRKIKKRRKKESGYVVLSGLRVSRLFLGKGARRYLDGITVSPEEAENVKLSTFVLQARRKLHFVGVDLAEKVAARLSASVKDIQQLKSDPTKLAELKLRVAGVQAMVGSASNQAQIGGMQWNVDPIPWLSQESGGWILDPASEGAQIYRGFMGMVNEQSLSPDRQMIPSRLMFEAAETLWSLSEVAGILEYSRPECRAEFEKSLISDFKEGDVIARAWADAVWGREAVQESRRFEELHQTVRTTRLSQLAADLSVKLALLGKTKRISRNSFRKAALSWRSEQVAEEEDWAKGYVESDDLWFRLRGLSTLLDVFLKTDCVKCLSDPFLLPDQVCGTSEPDETRSPDKGLVRRQTWHRKGNALSWFDVDTSAANKEGWHPLLSALIPITAVQGVLPTASTTSASESLFRRIVGLDP